ncbi:hypothetical protein [Alteromonas sp. M12]|uniref:hypothetical protein n=1 Tax=Alteromonas sp. M12 TaxID=3135644 RepID=UPI00319DDCED
MNRFIVLLLLFAIVSCAKFETAPTRTFDISSGVVDLSIEVGGNWDKVCFITPYTDNAGAKEVLGFDFNVEEKSGISILDGITLVIATKGSQVIEYFETPRSNIDFSSLNSGCFSKFNAKFKVVKDNNGWPNVQNT